MCLRFDLHHTEHSSEGTTCSPFAVRTIFVCSDFLRPTLTSSWVTFPGFPRFRVPRKCLDERPTSGWEASGSLQTQVSEITINCNPVPLLLVSTCNWVNNTCDGIFKGHRSRSKQPRFNQTHSQRFKGMVHIRLKVSTLW